MPFIFRITLTHVTQALLGTVSKTKGTLGTSTEIQLIVFFSSAFSLRTYLNNMQKKYLKYCLLNKEAIK